MLDLLELHKYFILKHIKEGDIVADFTMGNGYDSEFLSKAVGEKGHLYAFDIQKQAVESTRKHLLESNCPNNYTLILDSHSKAKEYIKEPIKAGMFNLGWLPGGDKSITTLKETTLIALQSSLDLLDNDGIINIAIYPGHKEGDLEGQMVEEFLSKLDKHIFMATKIKIVNSDKSPYFFIIEKK